MPVKQLGQNGLAPVSDRDLAGHQVRQQQIAGGTELLVLEMQHPDLLIAVNRHLFERSLQALGRLQQLLRRELLLRNRSKDRAPSNKILFEEERAKLL